MCEVAYELKFVFLTPTVNDLIYIAQQNWQWGYERDLAR